MNLDRYHQAISLFTPLPDTDQPGSMASVLAEIAQDPALSPWLAQSPQPETPEQQREWIRALLTVRPASNNQALFAAMDHLLASESRHHPITDANHLTALASAEVSRARLSLWQGDITRLAADAIVNAANAQLEGCFQPFHACIDNAIHSVAGPRLREDCNTLIQLQGALEPTGTAKITRGYQLPARFVLHTVGPIIHRGADVSSSDRQALADCYRACLDLAAETGVIRSIAFCSISTGVFGFPKPAAAQIACQTVSSWLEANPGKIEHVIFNTFDTQTTALYKEEFNQWSM